MSLSHSKLQDQQIINSSLIGTEGFVFFPATTHMNARIYYYILP